MLECFTINRYFKISNYIFSKKPKPTDLEHVLYKAVKVPARWEMIYRLFMKFLTFLQTTILLLFLQETQKIYDDINFYMLFGLPAATLVIQMLIEYLREEIIIFNATIWGGLNRLLRGLFFKKITMADITFLNAADESIIRKFDIYQMNTMIKFFCLYPTIMNFPLMSLLSVGLMSYYIEYFTLVALALFLTISGVLYFIIKRLSRENLRLEHEACHRALVMDEVLAKLREIKNDGMEDFFSNKISKIRKKE